MPENHQPQSNAWTIAVPPNTTHIIFAQIGIQAKKDNESSEYLNQIKNSFHLPDSPKHYESSFHVDSEGYKNTIIMAYWDNPQAYYSWLKHSSVQEWWSGKSIDRNGPIGYWSEIATIPMTHFETLYSQINKSNGVSHFIPIKPTNVHEYWGSMRDRIPASATGDFENNFNGQLSAKEDKDTLGKRIKIIAPKEVCLIRTAQDWSKCGSDEKKTYVDLVEPTLKKGNQYLSQNPKESGCISSKLVYELNSDEQVLEKSCVIAYFTSLDDLERWTHTHPTHKAIYGTFFEMLKRYNYATELALWHEVSMIQSEDLQLEYVNCHPKTGFIPYFEAIEIDL